ncbi:MAG: glycoside hydrolase family 3 C-terminal domain-containing protein [Chthoniobacterales bacterium]
MKLAGLNRVALTGLCAFALSAYGQQGSNNVEQRVNNILSQFTLEEKLSYIGGTGFFDIKPIPVPNLQVPINPQIFQTDGPLGVRRNSPGIRFASGLTLAATWNRSLARQVGIAMGRDTRARGYFSILGPGMDFYRVPMGGRNFEYMNGEDPFLGGQLVPGVIQGIQSQGVWACAKHFVCNDEEANRTNVQILLDDRTLREIYLPVFEAAVKDGHVATVMGAYNAVNGFFCSENPFLLLEVLKKEWGFKGLLMSDYNAIHDGLTAALNGCDLDLPAGNFMNSKNLSPFIPAPLQVATIDDKVRRILREVVSFGYLDRQQLDPSIPLDDPVSEATALNEAREGIILLKNEGNLLPLSEQVHTIAVLGPFAQGSPPSGFGSSYVTPISFVSVLEGIENEVSPGTTVDLISTNTLDPANATWEFVNANGELQQGLQAEYFTSNDLSGTAAVTRVDNHLNFDWDINPIPVSQNQGGFSARWTGQVRPVISGDHVFKVRGDGGLRVIVNGQTLFDNFNSPTLPPVGYGPTPAYSGKIALQAGQVYSVEIDYRRVSFATGGGGFFDSFEQGGLTGVQASWASLQAPPNFAKYDAVVICAGISNEYEGEGEDRPFQLPEFQDELISNLANVNHRTIVVFHGGGNFDSHLWINRVSGLIESFYPGQNGGQALAEILFGDVNPSGKLPVTFEKRIEDNPAFATFPNPLNSHPDAISYSEGIFIGYRGYEKNHVKPLFPFGFGLSYTTFAYSDLKIEPATFTGTEPAKVSFTVTNTGKVAGAEIAELYVGQENPPISRPIKELKGFEKVFLEPGQSKTVTLGLNQRSFAYFNTATEKWDALPGTYKVLVGGSSQNTPLSGTVVVPAVLTANP